MNGQGECTKTGDFGNQTRFVWDARKIFGKIREKPKNTAIFDGKNATFSDFTQEYVVTTIDVFHREPLQFWLRGFDRVYAVCINRERLTGKNLVTG